MRSSWIIRNARILLESGEAVLGTLEMRQGRIAAIDKHIGNSVQSSDDIEIIDADGGWLLPGFIDVHVHGGNGSDFMDATPQALRAITEFHGAHGTTAMLSTTVTAPRAAIGQAIAAAHAYMESSPQTGARLLGNHIEGPFISAKWPGAQNPAHIAAPRTDWIDDWQQRYPGCIRMVTLAPETDGADELIRQLTQAGIVAACGHTDASYDEICRAADLGLRHAVHTFNAMRGLHHREPGTVGAVLADDRLSCEVIADGLHVHPACIRILATAKGPNQLLLITDAMAAAGLGDGDYALGGLDVVVRDGAARLKVGGQLAGSTLTMMSAFRYAALDAGIGVETASRMASGNPARLLGIADHTGSICIGKQADLVLLTPELQLLRVWRQGMPLETATK